MTRRTGRRRQRAALAIEGPPAARPGNLQRRRALHWRSDHQLSLVRKLAAGWVAREDQQVQRNSQRSKSNAQRRVSRAGSAIGESNKEQQMRKWYSWVASNHRPPVPQTGALTI